MENTNDIVNTDVEPVIQEKEKYIVSEAQKAAQKDIIIKLKKIQNFKK